MPLQDQHQTTRRPLKEGGLKKSQTSMFNHILRGFSQGSVVLVSFLSSYPGCLLLLPTPIICLIVTFPPSVPLSLHTFVVSSTILWCLVAGYLCLISYYVFCSLLLYLISESDYRMKVIDFLGRDFTKRFLENPQDHRVRVIVVPALIFCIFLVVTHTNGN